MFELFENPAIDSLVGAKESQIFDRVGERIQWRDIGNLMMGFANADGGVVAVGIEKDKTITGVEDIYLKTSEIRKAAAQWIIPPLTINTKPIQCQNHKGESSHILLVELPLSSEVHSNQKDEVYLRIGDENLKLTHQQRMALLDERGEMSFELTEARGATLGDLDGDIVEEYRQAINIPNIPTEDLLIGRDLASREQRGITINMAGILLFGKKPERWVERARVRVLRYEGDVEKTGEQFNIVKDIPIYGPLPYQIRETHAVLSGLLRDFTVLDQSGKFITQKEYPDFAWKEAIVNALVHRAYGLRGADIQVKMFDNRLEVISPGRFPGPVTKNNIKDTHYSRNPRIARVMAELGFIKEIGEGVNRIIEEMQSAGLPEPVFVEKAAAEVLVQLENDAASRDLRKKANLGTIIEREVLQVLSPSDREIIAFVMERGKITTKECESLVGKHRMTALRYISSLAKRSFLKRVGDKGPKVHYILGSKLVLERKHRGIKTAQGKLL